MNEPSISLPPAPEEIPDEGDEEVDRARRRQRQRVQSRSNTLLTGGAGVTDLANVGKKKLLGA